MEKNTVLTKEDFIPSYQIAEPPYVWSLIALIIAIIFGLFLFQSISIGV